MGIFLPMRGRWGKGGRSGRGAGEGGIANMIEGKDHTQRNVMTVAASETGGLAATRTRGRVMAGKRSPESKELLLVLERMGRGDHAALAKAYDLIGGAVFSLAVRMMRDRQAAEDVTQDIFVQVWRQSAGFDTSRGSGEAWIMMIARSRILDRLRSRSAGIRMKSVGDALPDAPAAEDWPEDMAIAREEAVAVREALRELGEDQRVAVELAFFEGLTHTQVAERLGVPLGTIKTRIRLGLLRIRDRLASVTDMDGGAEPLEENR